MAPPHHPREEAEDPHRPQPVADADVEDAVVDPGVGSGRRGLAAEASGYRFIAPDNGVLTLVFRDSAPRRVVELTERKYARPTVSRTFEGRDRFAPAAAWLAKGVDLSALGRPVTTWQTLSLPEPIVSGSLEA